LEAYGDSLFLVVQTAQLVDGSLAFGETQIFFGARYLVTVRHGASLSYAPARRSCEQARELMRNGPSYGLYGVLDFIVDNLLPIVREFREELHQLEADIFAETFKRSTVRRLYDMQRDLMTLRLAVAPLQDITSQLVRLHPQLIPDELRVYFRDVYDHVFRVNESISAMREMLAAAINVNLSLVTFGQNEVMKRLAGYAAMLAAPTLLTSWYGMNFTHMPELDKPWAYPLVIVLVVGVVGSIYVWLKRAKWL
jgi:magnesium transporter